MAIVNKDTLKSWFLRGMKPLSGQFTDWLDSYWHKHEKISISSIDKLETILSCKAENNDMQVHRQDNRNPHGVDKAQVGLGNADNTADRDKPVSTATQVAINGVQANLDDHNEGGTAHPDIRQLIENTRTADTGNCSVTFTEAAEKAGLVSGETHATLFGKIQKWLSGLKTVAFTGQAADITQDASHRFVTDAEKTGWDDKYTTSQTDAKDTDTLLAAQTHTAQKIAEIVNGSPEALDTLWELAKALGNDPNFATTVMNAIGTKANTVHNHTVASITNLQSELDGKAAKNGDSTKSFTADAFFANKINVSFNRPQSSGIEMLSSKADGVEGSFNKYASVLSVLSSYVGFQLGTYGGATEDLRFRKRSDSTTSAWTPWREIWHAGNFNPNNFRKEIALYDVNNIDPDTATVGLILTEHINAPTPTGSWYIQTLFYINLGGSSCMQIATQYTNGNNMYIRNRYAKGEWSPWEQIAKTSEVQNQLALKANRADLKTVAFTGDYNDLANRPDSLLQYIESGTISKGGNYLTAAGSCTCRVGFNNYVATLYNGSNSPLTLNIALNITMSREMYLRTPTTTTDVLRATKLLFEGPCEIRIISTVDNHVTFFTNNTAKVLA